MSIKSFVVAASFLAVSAFSANASPVVVKATGDGWCDSSFCNNTNTNVFNNNDLSQSINNWQAFTLGKYGTITGATLSIYESSSYGSFYNYGQGDINFFLATGLTFAGLQAGPSIGTLRNGSSNAVGTYVNIALNSYGLQQLNLLQGSSFVIGGSNGGSTIDAFGFSSNITPAPFITLQTAAAAVPEPGSIALLGLGVAGFAVARRKSAKASKA
jgi:hypothetical protein